MARRPTPHATPGRGRAPSLPSSPSTLTLTISLAEIYALLCPACRDALVDLLSHKAAGNIVADALRQALETPPPVGAPLAAPPDPGP